MKRAEIIAAMRQAAREGIAGVDPESEEGAAYERYIAALLERRLRQVELEMDFRSCADFTHLGVECCPVCHDEYRMRWRS